MSELLTNNELIELVRRIESNILMILMNKNKENIMLYKWINNYLVMKRRQEIELLNKRRILRNIWKRPRSQPYIVYKQQMNMTRKITTEFILQKIPEVYEEDDSGDE